MFNEWANVAIILIMIAGMVFGYYVGKAVGYDEAREDKRKRKLIYDRNRLMR